MMTSVQVESLLKEYLDELNDDKLKEFKWYLSLTDRKDYRPIPRYQLEKATREETVDKLVQVYGEDGAVEMTVEAFGKMNLNEPAVRLNQANENRNMKKRSLKVSSTARQNQSDVDGTVPQHVSCQGCSVLTEPGVLQCDHTSTRTCVHHNWKQKLPITSSFCCQVQYNTKPPTKTLFTSRRRGRAELSTGCRNDSESDQIPSKKIKEKKEAFEKVRYFCASSIEQVKSQSCDAQRKIKDDFEKLHVFLATEEKTRLAAIKREETQNIRRMELITEISRKTFSLSDDVKELEECGSADDLFIQNFRTQLERTQNMLSDPQQLPQAQINESEHVENLQHKVRKKMFKSKTHNTEVLAPSVVYTRLPPSDGVTKMAFEDLWHRLSSEVEGEFFGGRAKEDLNAEEETHDKESSEKPE